MTISQAEEDILKSYNLHANCYITKPIDLNQFIKVVKSIEDFWFSIVKLPPKTNTLELSMKQDLKTIEKNKTDDKITVNPWNQT